MMTKDLYEIINCIIHLVCNECSCNICNTQMHLFFAIHRLQWTFYTGTNSKANASRSNPSKTTKSMVVSVHPKRL